MSTIPSRKSSRGAFLRVWFSRWHNFSPLLGVQNDGNDYPEPSSPELDRVWCRIDTVFEQRTLFKDEYHLSHGSGKAVISCRGLHCLGCHRVHLVAAGVIAADQGGNAGFIAQAAAEVGQEDLAISQFAIK